MADTKQGKQSKDLYNGTQSRIVLAKPKLGGFGSSALPSSTNKGNTPFGSLLRPAQLKPTSNLIDKTVAQESSPEKEKNCENSENKSVENVNNCKENEDAPKFVPLGSANVTTRTTTGVPTTVTSATTSSVGFVFGQNLSERVVMKEALNNGESQDNHSSKNGTSDLLFTNAAATNNENHQEDPGSNGESRSESLAAAAAEYERSHARPPPPTTNCTMTGEEGETNVLQMSCRLFTWEAGGWRERGRGVLRLNDGEGGSARLVARVAGSLRVALNTQLWSEMVVELAGAKSLRITATDAQLQIKLFLIMGAPVDIAQLHRALQMRVTRIKKDASSKDGGLREHDKESEDCSDAKEERDSDRLLVIPESKTDCDVSDKLDEENESKSIKRKEDVEAPTSPKRPCQDVSVQ